MDGRISKEDKTVLGSPYPDFFGGFNTDLEYKNFSLNVFWQYSYGNKIFNVLKFWLDVGGTSQANNGKGATISNKRAQNTGNYISLNTVSTFPYDPVYNPENIDVANLLALNQDMVKVDENFLDGNKASSFFIEDASYLRLKNINLTYNFDKKLLKTMKLSGLRIYAGAENILTFTKYSGMDPEIGSSKGSADANLNMGIDYGTYPQARTYFVGLNVAF
jgi:TonB-dependent starch-binding outer membrane protein SusC